MFAKTQKSVSMILGVALVAAATFAAPALAGEATLSQNEHAAQSAIAGTRESAPASTDASPATLARNESLAQRAIVDATAFEGSARHRSRATTSVVSMRSPAAH